MSKLCLTYNGSFCSLINVQTVCENGRFYIYQKYSYSEFGSFIGVNHLVCEFNVIV